MKVWKRTLSAVMTICLVFSLFVGLDFTSAAAAGALVNGALTANTEGWTIEGDIAETNDSNAEVACSIQDGTGSKHLSIWNKSAEEKTFSMSQTISNMEAGSYTAKVQSVGNGNTKHNLVLKAHNDTKNTEVKVNIGTKEWDVYVESATIALEVAEGDTVTISISGPLEAKASGATDGEWYGIKNVQFEAAPSVQAPITVKKVPNLSEDFIHGVDVSTYLSEVQSGVVYRDENGVEKNMFEIFKDAGVNYVRFRVWNCPFRTDADGKILYVDDAGTEYDEDQVTAKKKWIIEPDSEKSFEGAGYNEYFVTGTETQVYREGYGAGNCDIDAAVEMGKIATYYGMKVLIDFHYSDFWADPAKMKSPKAWTTTKTDEETGKEIEVSIPIADKVEALSKYTEDSLKKLKEAGVDVGMVQVGNEINGGMAGEKDWTNISKLLDAGTKAVRKVDPNIQIAIHYADPHKDGFQVGKAKALNDAKIDYDVFASSYYSFWHGTPENLTAVLKEIATTYNKKVMVAEVSYLTTLDDGDGAANVEPKAADPLNYSVDAQGEGQAAAVRDAIAAVAAVGDKGIGTFYWEPAWVPVGNYAGASADKKAEVLTSNIDKWEKYGSGWASMWSGPEGGGYDPEVSEVKSTHGSQWDNQAMFDFDGKALPSINVYKWVYTGTEGPVRVATVDTASYTMNYKATPQLPAAVNVNLNDGNVVENVAVNWDTEQVEALKTALYGDYTVEGSLAAFTYDSKGDTISVAAGEQKTTCLVKVTGTNALSNGSFENGDTGWTISGGSVKNDGAGGNAKDGKGYVDAWNASKAETSAEQTITEKLPSGKYMLFGYYQGTNVATVDEGSGLTATVTYANGETKTYTGEIQIRNVWKDFYQAKVLDILINQNVSSIKVTSSLVCSGSGSGPWIVMDDINLMPTGELTADEEAFGASTGSETPVTYTVTFKDGDTVISTQTVEAGAAATAPTAPTKEGYTFEGWDKAFDNVTSNLTVNAKWKQNGTGGETTTYTVTFKDGDTVISTQTVEAGAAATAPTAPTKEGYTFEGWDKAFDNVTSNLTVNAKWKQNGTGGETTTYTVTFKDGDTVISTQTVEAGAAATAPTAPTKEGYTFEGWDKAFDNVTSNLTVNAKWTQNQGQGPGTQEQKYTVTFNVNGGTAIKTKTASVTAGKTYGTLPKATRKGYTFSGWYTAKSGGQKITSATKVTISKDTTLYAQWKKVAKPAKVKKVKVKNTKKNTIKVTFKKIKGVAGYEIRYATKSSMKGAKKATTKKTSATIKNKKVLKKGRTCYVQVRAYKMDSAGKKVYSKSYSAKAKIKIKK